MSILISKNTEVLVQGITGSAGSLHTKLMLEYGTKIVAGVTPGKGGQLVHGIPVYDMIKSAMREHDIDASIIFVPARFTLDAALEAVHAGIQLIIIITEGVPMHDTMKIRAAADEVGANILGPNCPGIIIPGETKIGIMPASAFAPGRVGVVSRSGTLTYEIANLLSQNGIGQSAVVGIGGDPVSGLSFVDILELFDKDEHTDAVLLVGEIGGRKEEDAAKFIKKMQKPLIAFVTGRCAPPGKRMGHAGAIIRADETAENKMRTLKKAGALVAKRLDEIPGLVRQGLVM